MRPARRGSAERLERRGPAGAARARILAALAAVLLLGGTVAGPAPARPAAGAATLRHLAPAGRVTDAARLLSARQISALNDYLATFEARTRHQMVVVTVPSLDGQDIAHYTRALANRWGVGRKGANDGIMVLVAPNEREMRIAVGYGLEKIVTDSYCRHVIETMMTPKFRQGRYYDGLVLGVTALARAARRA